MNYSSEANALKGISSKQPLCTIMSYWQIVCLDNIARAGRKYRGFFAQLVVKVGEMALNSQSWTKI